MEYPWRSMPPPGNFCPVCSHSHFPFCTPPPPQYFRPPPPPPDQFYRSPLPPPPPPQAQASYDPFVDHQGGPVINAYPAPPAPPQIPPRPWNGDPNYGNGYYGNPNSGLDHDVTGQVGVKRMRYDSGGDGYAVPWAEDERRLKLIREHGAVSHGLDRKYDGGCSVSNRSYEPNSFQGMESGYPKEINSSFNQNYGEPRAPYPNIESNRPVHNQSKSSVLHNHGYINSPGANGYMNSNVSRGNHEIPAYDGSSYHEQNMNFSTENRDFNNQFLRQHRMEPQSSFYAQGFKAQPPLPTSPPPPLPVEPPRFPISEPVSSSGSSFHSPYSTVSEAVSSHFTSKGYPNSSGYHPEEIRMARMPSSKTFNGESEGYLPKNHSVDKPKIVDASYILKHPHRASRPDHIVIILRGLPGSGKSYLAKILRDIEVENGGTAPRIHSMDEYFMTEIEKVEESEGSRSKVSTRGKRPVTRTVMEYCYEPEMEEAYRSSMLKAFKKTLDEGAFPFVIVDDRNLRVADFAQFWATAKVYTLTEFCGTKWYDLICMRNEPPDNFVSDGDIKRSGYEVYILEATYKDPAGCAARNVHGFTQNDIFKMANQWEDAPSLYMKLDGKSLLHGDDLEENGIEEVDMDMEDGSHISDTSGSEVINAEKDSRPSDGVHTTGGPSTDKQKEDGEEENLVEVVKDLGKSKWSNDLDDDDVPKTEATRGNSTALSSLTKSYSKKGKSVRWADQIGRIGFSINAGKTANVSLIVGPGSGYNLKTNPLLEEEKLNQKLTGESRTRKVFQEQLRAERESFRAAFDKRKHRIGGIGGDEE